MSETVSPELSAKKLPIAMKRIEGRREKLAREIRPLLDMLAEYTVKLDDVGRRMIDVKDKWFTAPDLNDTQWLTRMYPYFKKLAQLMSQKLESDLDDSILIELELRLADFEVALLRVSPLIAPNTQPQ